MSDVDVCGCIVGMILDLSLWWFFFFQAEDGIRDLVRSRGLGDVYKRQSQVGPGYGLGAADLRRRLRCDGATVARVHRRTVPVSYTHLTLPTSDLV